MCGIAGELSWISPANREAVDAMVSGIAHRGPDDRGLWSSPTGVCALGHARLSIVDLSPAGHQPMLDALTGNAIVFNGEIYNFQVLRKDCESAGDVFKSRSDTEVILALYRRHGLDCLKLLRGMFAFVIWDEQRQQLVMARDRVGKKPLNYAVTHTGLAFCSELHPLSRHPGVDNGMDPEALELYLQCQFIPAPWTIYRGMRKLPPAHYAIYDRNGLKIEKYWEIDYRDKIRISEADVLDTLEEKLTEAVRLRMIADVPLGALLSGGVDSSVVVALMAKLSNEPVRTFSVGFEEQAFNELPWAQQAAERCGTQHHPDIVKGDVEHLLPRLARHYGEPFADSSAVPSFAVSRSARRHVTVAMNGDGGDELLGGYERYSLPNSALRSSALLGRRLPPARLADMASRLQATKTIHGRVLRKLLTLYTNPELRSVIMFADFWHDAARRELFPDGPDVLLRNWRRRWLEDAFAHAHNPIDRMLWLDNHTYLPGDLLVKMDIASMHCGLETRSPLLDHVVIEFCARLPIQCKVNGQVRKYLLKKLAERYFPADFVHRPKMGFGIPLAAWLRGPLREVLRETLLDAHLMAPLSGTVIAQTLRQFDTGDDGHCSRLWALLMFGYWRRQQVAGVQQNDAPSGCRSLKMSDTATKRLRIGILVDRRDLLAWECAMLGRIVNSRYAEVVLVVQNNEGPATHTDDRSPGIRSHFLQAVRRMMYAFRGQLENKVGGCNPYALAVSNDIDQLRDFPHLYVTLTQPQVGASNGPFNVEKIREFHVDVFISLGISLLREDILSVPKYGVWSFLHADDPIDKSGAAGFWEVFHDLPVTESTLRILGETRDGERVIGRTITATSSISVKRNRNNLYWKASLQLPRKLEELWSLGPDLFFEAAKRNDEPPATASNQVLATPRLFEEIALPFRLFWRIYSNRIRSLLVSSQWVLLFAAQDESTTWLFKFRKIIPPRDRFWADPHVLFKDERYYVFIEEFPYRLKKGYISVMEMKEDGTHTTPRGVLEESHHLSNPFVFEHDQQIFLIPESARNRTVDLYRCVSFPDKWEHCETLLKDVHAVDTTVHYYQGKWWLFTNIREHESESSNDELFLFYSDDLRNGRWRAHPRNPIVSDVTRARPAGRLFEHEGQLYRPAQDCSIRYGYGLRIQAILKMSESEYLEREVAFIQPRLDEKIVATHTFSRAGHLVLSDALEEKWKLFPGFPRGVG